MAKNTKSTKTTKTTKTTAMSNNALSIRNALDLELQKMGVADIDITCMLLQLNRVARSVAAAAERQLKRTAVAKAKAEKLAARRAAIQTKIDNLQKQADALGK